MPPDHGKRKCPECVFFERNSASAGLCRLLPPTVIPTQLRDVPITVERTTKPFTTWPIVRNEDWCGDFQSPNSGG